MAEQEHYEVESIHAGRSYGHDGVVFTFATEDKAREFWRAVDGGIKLARIVRVTATRREPVEESSH